MKDYDIVERLVEIRESQIRIEEDLKYHIKRTDLLEDRIDRELRPVHKAFIGVKWTVGALITLTTILAGLARLEGII